MANTSQKSFPYKEKYCEDCTYHMQVPDSGGRDKWLCFGLTRSECRKSKNIPDEDAVRLCLHHKFEFEAKEYFQLNVNTKEVGTIIDNLQILLRRMEGV